MALFVSAVIFGGLHIFNESPDLISVLSGHLWRLARGSEMADWRHFRARDLGSYSRRMRSTVGVLFCGSHEPLSHPAAWTPARARTKEHDYCLSRIPAFGVGEPSSLKSRLQGHPPFAVSRDFCRVTR